MKKGLILAAALVLVATSALASSVVNSKHNMDNIAGLTSNPTQEVCVFCHTPHAANTAVSNAPLWNRGLNLTATTLYNSATLNTASRPSTVSSSITASDAPLCLSCHDGTTVTDALFNPPNGGAPVWSGFSWTNTDANIGSGTNNLSNDHPIGMDYNAVQTSVSDAGGFFPVASVTAKLDLYNGRMWCSTCHDVHDDANYPFLATTNVASALCITCHNK